MAPGIDYFYKRMHNWPQSEIKSGYDMFAANVDFHYLIPLTGRLKVYPVLGAAMVISNHNTIHPEGREQRQRFTDWGASMGLGAQYDLGKRWFIQAEAIYKWAPSTETRIVSLGGGFKF